MLIFLDFLKLVSRDTINMMMTMQDMRLYCVPLKFTIYGLSIFQYRNEILGGSVSNI